MVSFGVRLPSRVLDIELPPFDPLNVRAAAARQGHRVITLGQALPFFPPPASALRSAETALRRRRARLLDRPGGPRCDGCSPNASVTTASPASRRPGDHGRANHAFATAVATLVNAGDEVVLPAPYFTNHTCRCRPSGAARSRRRWPISDRTG
jgi:hypothetical protein